MTQAAAAKQERPLDRWRQALARVAGAERATAAITRPWRRRWWRIHGRTGIADHAEVASLPEPLQPSGRAKESLKARVAADVVVIGKFDVDSEVRLRAFYLDSAVSMRFQAGGARNGVDRTLDAYAHVHRYAPALMPRVLSDGRLGKGRYLFEETVFGSHPAGRAGMQEVAHAVAAALRPMHEGVGITEQPLSEVLSPAFEKRWAAAVESVGIDEHVDRAVGELVEREGLLDVSLGHGDLVGSNIIDLGDRIMLIDWEYSGQMPIAFDLAKIHAYCPDPHAALVDIDRGLGGVIGTTRGHYSLAEQVALAHARYVSWLGVKTPRAEAAGRSKQLQHNIALRLTAIRTLLDL